MKYIYDIVLNFNKQYFNFFEWNINDNIIKGGNFNGIR